MQRAPAPIILTIPLSDPLVGSGAASLAAAYATQRKNYSFTCPSDDGSVSVGSLVPARVSFASAAAYAAAAAGGRNATNATKLRVSRVLGVSYLALAPQTASVSASSLYAYASSIASRAPAYVTITAHVFELVADCGALMGTRTLTCGPGFYDAKVNFSCPDLAVQPICAFWSEALGEWSSAGCVVVNTTATALVCACSHLTNFAGRFAALSAEQQDVFAHSADLFAEPSALIGQYPHVFIIVGVILCVTLASLFVTSHLDAEGVVRYYQSLKDDEEVQFLARIEELKGHVSIKRVRGCAYYCRF